MGEEREFPVEELEASEDGEDEEEELGDATGKVCGGSRYINC